MERKLSQEEYQKACQYIPRGVDSPVRSFPDLSETPLIVESGKGAEIVDIDGNRYIDYCGSWGALIHGHAHPKIHEKVSERLSKGSSFGISTRIERQAAQAICERVPNVDQVRFVNSGTEATMSAIRLARGFTGKNLVMKFIGNYHGHADHLLVKAGSGATTLNESSSAGVPNDFAKHTVCLPYNNVEALEVFMKEDPRAKELATVIIEPVAGNMGVVPASQDFMHAISELCGNLNALLIFDEVMTGFRVSRIGAQAIYNVKPDLFCFGKVMGGGFPAAAFGGRRDIMDHLAPGGQVYQAGTLSGNPVAMEAGLQSLALSNSERFYEELEEKTRIITDPVKNALESAEKPACVQQVGSMFTLFFGKRAVNSMDDAQSCDAVLFSKFFSSMLKRGIYFSPSMYEAHFVSMAHSESQLNYTRDAVLSFVESECLASSATLAAML